MWYTLQSFLLPLTQSLFVKYATEWSHSEQSGITLTTMVPSMQSFGNRIHSCGDTFVLYL